MTKKSPGRPFPKGVSGNPKGRPPTGRAIAELARTEIDKHGLVVKLGHIAARGRGVTQLRAIEVLLHYAFGKPREEIALQHSGTIESDVDPGAILESRMLQLEERRRAARASLTPEAGTSFGHLALVGADGSREV